MGVIRYVAVAPGSSVGRVSDPRSRGPWNEPVLSTGGGVGSHLTSPIRMGCQVLDYQDLGN